MSWVAVGTTAASALGSIWAGNKASDAMKTASAQSNAMAREIYETQRSDQMPYMQSGYQALNAYNRAMGLPTVSTAPSSGIGGMRRIPILHGKSAVHVDAEGNGYVQAVAGNNAGQWIPIGKKYPEYAQPAQQGQPEGQPGDDRYGGFYASPGYQFRLDEGTRALDRSASARGLLLSGAQNKALTRYGQGVASEEFGNYTNRLAALAGLGQTANQSVASSAGQYGANAGNAIMNSGMARASGYLNTANTIGSVANNVLAALPYLQTTRAGKQGAVLNNFSRSPLETNLWG